MANDLDIAIGVTDQTAAGFGEVQSSISGATSRVRQSLGGLGTTAREAGAHVNSFENSIRNFVREERANDRLGGFFAKEIATVIPMSALAKDAVGKFAGAIAEGGLLGFAMAGAQIGLQALSEHFQEAKKQAEEATRAAATAAAQLVKLSGEIESHVGKVFLGMKKVTPEEAFVSKVVGPLEDRLRSLSLEVESKRAELERLKAGGTKEEVDKAQKELRALADQEATLQTRITELKSPTGAVASAFPLLDVQRQKQVQGEINSLRIDGELKVREARLAKAKQAVEDEKGSFASLDAYKIALAAVTEERIAQARLAGKKHIDEVEASSGKYTDAEKAQMRVAIEENTQGEITAIRQNAAQEQLTVYKAGDAAHMKKLQDELDREQAAANERGEILMKQQELEQRQKQKAIATYKEWGETAGNIIGGLITKHMTLGQAMVQVGQMIIQSVVKTAIASITADAGRAGAGAAASQAGIPVAGPVLAIAAMGAIMSQVLGLLGNMPSAAGGMKVPNDMLALVHEDERVLPARYSRGLDRLVENGGAAPLIGTVVATDAESFGRQLQNQDSALVKGLEKAARRRRGRRV